MTKALSLVQGTLDILILRALEPGARHGYGVVDWIHEVTDGALHIEDGALYTALHRMEQRGWLSSNWGISARGRRAKFYALTAKGQRQLRDGRKQWAQYAAAVSKVLE